MRLKRLNKEEKAGLYQEYSHSQPFRNIIRRFDDAGFDVWLLELGYRSWSAVEMVPHGGKYVVQPRREANRLFLCKQIEGRRHELAAALVLPFNSDGSYGFRPPYVGRTTILKPGVLVREPVHLLTEEYRLFVPDLLIGEQIGHTFPYVQQDVHSYRCIDACLWMMMDFMSHHVGSARVPLGLIRPDQLRGRHHLLPTPGLQPEEVPAVVMNAGLTCLSYGLHSELSVPIPPIVITSIAPS